MVDELGEVAEAGDFVLVFDLLDLLDHLDRLDHLDLLGVLGHFDLVGLVDRLV